MKVPVYNQKGEEVSTTLLPKEIFGVPLKEDVVHEAVLAQTSNQRRSIAKVKTREEVRGGGKKPWRQKGTGRARHGSIRSPLWKGGGVTFGPSPKKNYTKKINKKMKRKALFMVLSAKAGQKLAIVLDNLTPEKPKTKIMAGILNNLFLKNGTGLVVLAQHDKSLVRVIRNIEGVRPITAKDLNVVDLMTFKYLLLTKDAIKAIKDTFLK